jgi:methyl-accepting chemotaxis protein
MRFSKSHRRRIYYIKKAYQKLFILRYMKMLLLGTIVTNLSIYFYGKARLTDSIYRAHISIKSASDVLITPFIMINAVVIVLAILWATYITLKGNSRLGKNLEHLSLALKELAEGNLSAEIKGVDSKLLGDFFQIFNRVTAMLRGKHGAIQNSIEAMEESLAGKEKVSPQTLESLSKQLKNIEDELSGLKLR